VTPGLTSAHYRLWEQPAMQASILYFDRFELDLNSYELRKGGRVIKLEKLPMELLILLAEKQGQLVTREQIIQRLWGDNVFVDSRQGINTAVRKLRVALHDDSEHPRLLQTVAGRGYRLLASVSTGDENTDEQAAPQIPLPSPLPPSTPPASTGLAVHWQENPQRTSPQKRWTTAATVAALVMLLAIGCLALFLWFRRHTTSPSRTTWVQITNFPDSATSPALSPDGRMIAFIRGPETFVTPGQIYVKMLPDGQPVQLTHDNSPKMAPVFSPDGSRIAYTATDRSAGWNTWVVPVLGGEPQELLPNAAALTWADRQHVVFSQMFSEIKSGLMGIATATESRSGERNVYLPTNIGGMAHRSWVSPDGKRILVSEMDRLGWLGCRVLPFDGSASGETVGPKESRCTYAAWSPDGKTVYFSADAGDGYHIWRQRFPRGSPEQMTFGPTEEEGIAVSPDGRSLVTSVGLRESTVWLHDSRGDRQISGEGYASVPGLGFGGGTAGRSVFSPDGKRVFYLVRKQASRVWTFGELWTTNLDSGRSEAVLPGVSMNQFQIAPDGERVAFTAQDAQATWHVWMAPLDRRTPPTQLTSSASSWMCFGPAGDVYLLAREGDHEFLYGIESNEALPRKISPKPIEGIVDISFHGDVEGIVDISPHGDWLLSGFNPATARSIRDGSAIRICNFCNVGWGPDGKFLYLRFRDLGEMGGGKTIVIGLPVGKDLPMLPPSGLKSINDAKGLNVVADIDMTGIEFFSPGPNPSVYAYSRVTVQRNLYRIPLK
jgi:Tol biopolymer transport system component/DNA-binding winged helix-turn-helix (wHTH) protein